MEALYAKLYDKYSKLKTKKFSEFDEISREQEEKFINFVSASEGLIQHLKSEIQNLQETVENLRNEIRSSSDDKCQEYQKLLMEEEQKNKTLSEENFKLKELVQEGHPRNSEDQSGRNREVKSPETAQVTTRSMRKRSRLSEDMVETDMVSPHTSKRHKETETLMVSQSQCCKTTYDGSSSSASCPFQDLAEHLLGMELSTKIEGEHVCIVVSHQASGLSFSLTSLKNSTGEESEVIYKVISLGTFARMTPEWMRDVITFGTSMVPIFFERVSRVIKLRC